MYFSLTFCLGSLLMSVTFFFPFPIPFSFLVWSVDTGNLSEAEYSEFLGRQQCTLLALTGRVMLDLPWPPFWTLTCALLGVLGFAVCQSSAAIKTGIFPQQKHSEMPLHTFYFIPFVVFATLESYPGNHIHALLILVTEWIILFI